METQDAHIFTELKRSLTKQLLPLLRMMHFDTKFISQPTNGSLWKIQNSKTSKDPRKWREKESMPTEKKGTMGLDFLGILHVVWLF